MKKPILCLDFDGVLHSYDSGWKGADVIPDPPVPGAMAFLVKSVEVFDVQVFSSRSNQQGGIEAMQDWLSDHMSSHFVKEMMPESGPLNMGEMVEGALEVLTQIKWPKDKPPAMISLDDRARQFTGLFPEPGDLLGFLPWNRKPAPVHQPKVARNCPFCDASDSFVERMHLDTHARICNCCGAKGPEVETGYLTEREDHDERAEELATVAWDARA